MKFKFVSEKEARKFYDAMFKNCFSKINIRSIEWEDGFPDCVEIKFG